MSMAATVNGLRQGYPFPLPKQARQLGSSGFEHSETGCTANVLDAVAFKPDRPSSKPKPLFASCRRIYAAPP